MKNKYWKWIPWAAIIIGIILRIILLIQNRNLFIDEVNVARNLNERGYIDLLKPLSYEQFAPPLFLWLSKLSLLLFGANEWSLRLFPFICSIVCLILFYRLLAKTGITKSTFYPLLIFATGLIYLRYATELKQYSSDVVITLILLLIALKYSIQQTNLIKFFIIWIISSSIALWLSMPSVFMIAGIGIFYLWEAIQVKKIKLLTPLAIIGILLMLQFLVYYKFLLHPSIQSDYLQNWHKPFLLNFRPFNTETVKHNSWVIVNYFGEMGGESNLNLCFNFIFLIVGCIYLIKTNIRVFFLFCLPLAFMIIAVFLHKFTLLPRVCLFSYPLILVIIAHGLEQIFNVSKPKIFKLIPFAACLIALLSFNRIKWVLSKPKIEKTTDSFAWVKQKQVKPTSIYINGLMKPSEIYYTSIHPDSARWLFMKNALIVDWSTNVDSLFKLSPQQCAIMYSWMDEKELSDQKKVFNKYYKVTDSLISVDQYVYLLNRK